MGRQSVTGDAGFETLPDMLRHRARVDPTKTAFCFQGAACSFAELWDGISRFAAHLMNLGIAPKDRVVLLLPNGPEFFFAFYGAQLAGGIAVPLFPGFGPDVSLSYADACGAKALVVPSELPRAKLDPLGTRARRQKLLVTDYQASAGQSSRRGFPRAARSDTAFLQYTSGSTGAPKGVMISHDNLFTNMHQMIAGMRITSDDVFVSWLPVYHDMGLILKTMVPFLQGCELHLLPTDLTDVAPWLRAIAEHRATFTAAPDFAYRLCLRHVPDPGRYDLSSLRVALNAAEPVRHETIVGFERAFSLKHVMVAAYGLAEATVGVSMWPPNTPAKVDAKGYVSVGKPFPEVEIAIVAKDAPVAVGQTGEIVVKSAAQPVGYFQNDSANAALFWKSGWVRTGDLGYIDDEGELFIVGRKKNVIIQSGRTIFAQEVERLADRVPGVRFSAAVGIDRRRLEGEQVYVFAEVKDPDEKGPEALDAVVIGIVSKVYEALGFRPGRVFLLKPKSIPKTYNGKLQHARLKELYLSGLLDKQILHPVWND